jgi:hypothetical protein
MMNTTRDQLLEFTPEVKYDRRMLIETRKRDRSWRVRTSVCVLSVMFAFVVALVGGVTLALFFGEHIQGLVARVMIALRDQSGSESHNKHNFTHNKNIRCALDKQRLAIEPLVSATEECRFLNDVFVNDCDGRNECEVKFDSACAKFFSQVVYTCKRKCQKFRFKYIFET